MKRQGKQPKHRPSGTYPFYRALIEMNHAFDNAIAVLGDIGKLRLLRLDYVYGSQINLEAMRATANYNALASAEDRERQNAYRYDRQCERWEESQRSPEERRAARKTRKAKK